MLYKHERYYFSTRGQEPDVECTELCPVLNNGVNIGSASCQKCKHCINSNADDWGCSWVYCEKLIEFLQNVKDAGGVSLVVRSINDLNEIK